MRNLGLARDIEHPSTVYYQQILSHILYMFNLLFTLKKLSF